MGNECQVRHQSIYGPLTLIEGLNYLNEYASEIAAEGTSILESVSSTPLPSKTGRNQIVCQMINFTLNDSEAPVLNLEVPSEDKRK